MAVVEATSKKYKFDAEGRMVVKFAEGRGEIRFRKPKGRDVREVERLSQNEGTSVDLAIAIMRLLSGESEDFFLDLDGEDLKEAIEAMSSFRVFDRSSQG